ncbi:TPA: ATP-binding cassette domain-containing protein, partial [Clostridioides difficile]
MNFAIEIKDLSKKYPNFLLDNINLNIPYGKIVGLIGENGAGKTTLISLILNQIKRDNGHINIFNMDNIENEIQ